MLRSLLSLFLLAGLLGVPLRADDKGDKNPKGKTDDKGDKNPQGKSATIEINIDQLPPEIAKQILGLLEKAKAGKPEEQKPGKKGGDEKPGKKGGDEKPGKKGGDEKGGKQPVVKSIPLSEAIAIAEKTTQGQAFRAERHQKGEHVLFSVELQGPGGERLRVMLDASGKAIQAKDGDKGKKGDGDKGKKGDGNKGDGDKGKKGDGNKGDGDKGKKGDGDQNKPKPVPEKK